MMKKNTMLVAGCAILASTMLGMGHDAKAAEENSKLTVTDHQTTYYTSKDLKTKRTAEPGKVFRTNGTVTIKGNRYYRIYQDKFAGYIRTNQVKTLVAKKMNDQYVVRKNANIWNNLYWTSKKAVTKKDSVYKVKYCYTLGNGVRYYSLYKTNKDGKSEWGGYTNAVNAKAFTATSMNQKVTVTKDTYNRWQNLYFTQKDGQYKKGQNFLVKRYYDLNGARYYSLYQTNKDGKSEWCGYINKNGVQPLKAVKVEDHNKDDHYEQMRVVKNVPIYSNLYLTQTNGNTKNDMDKMVNVNYSYKFGNGQVYYSIASTKDNKWLGYVSQSALSNGVTESMKKEIQRFIDQANTVMDKVPQSVLNQKDEAELKDGCHKGEQLLKDNTATADDYNDMAIMISSMIDELELNMKPLQDLVKKAEELLPKATGEAKTALENAIKKGKSALNNALTVVQYKQYYDAAKALDQAMKAIK